jgi:uncharacterized protein (DUF1800 family)
MGAGMEAGVAAGAQPALRVGQIQLLNRLSWGVSLSAARELAAQGTEAYLERQLHPQGPAVLVPAVAQQIAAMRISAQAMPQMVMALREGTAQADALADPEQRRAATEALEQQRRSIGRETASRAILLALYSPDQLREQMTWFWMNHFNVWQHKANLRLLIADYEDRAIRAHALGRFRDLLGATVHHPAMLRYLDNEHNARGHLNENYARELMELHTLGVGAGYTQQDVQALARVLTGLGINLTRDRPKLRPALAREYVREGLFEFNPERHDYGAKFFLGAAVVERGLRETDEVLDRLARHPATARLVSRKLAVYFVSDNPPQALIDRLAARFLATDGDIASVLGSLFESPELAASLGQKFKDPMHFVISALRMAYDERPILNAGPVINWLARMGEPLYGHDTPEGYALAGTAWSSASQMATRFEIARVIGSGSAGLFRSEGPPPLEQPAFPRFANGLYYAGLEAALRPQTRQGLEQAGSAQEWNLFWLSSPEFMHR